MLNLKLLSPLGCFLDQDVDEVSVCGIEGMFTVLSNHMNLNTMVVAGTITYKVAGVSTSINNGEGAFTLKDNNIIILCNDFNS